MGVRVTVEREASGQPFQVHTGGPAYQALAAAMEKPLTLMHAPNESVHPDEMANLALTEALFLRRYADGRHRPQRSDHGGTSLRRGR